MMRFLRHFSLAPGLLIACLILPIGYVAGWIWIGLLVGYREAIKHLDMKLN